MAYKQQLNNALCEFEKQTIEIIASSYNNLITNINEFTGRLLYSATCDAENIEKFLKQEVEQIKRDLAIDQKEEYGSSDTNVKEDSLLYTAENNAAYKTEEKKKVFSINGIRSSASPYYNYDTEKEIEIKGYSITSEVMSIKVEDDNPELDVKPIVRVQRSEKGPPFACDQCTFVSRHRANLYRHVKIVHKELREYKCDQCDKWFTQKSNMQKHLKSMHSDVKEQKIKDFICNKCEYGSSTKGNLIRHIKGVHANKKGFNANDE